MNVVPLAPRETMDQRIKSAVYIVVLSESMKILLRVCPTKEMGPHEAKKKVLSKPMKTTREPSLQQQIDGELSEIVSKF